jgi:hypothetical protein
LGGAARERIWATVRCRLAAAGDSLKATGGLLVSVEAFFYVGRIIPAGARVVKRMGNQNRGI